MASTEQEINFSKLATSYNLKGKTTIKPINFEGSFLDNVSSIAVSGNILTVTLTNEKKIKLTNITNPNDISFVGDYTDTLQEFYYAKFDASWVPAKGRTVTGTVFDEQIDVHTYEATGENLKKNLGLTINANAGDDIVIGTDYKDTITGGAGNDKIFGGKSDDTITGGLGTNTIVYKKEVFDTDTVKLTAKENLVLDLSAYGFNNINALKAGSTIKVNGKNLDITLGDNGTIKLMNFVQSNTVGKDGSVKILLKKETAIDAGDAVYVNLNTDNVLSFSQTAEGGDFVVKNNKATFTGTRLNDTITSTNSGKSTTINGGAGHNYIMLTDNTISHADTVNGGNDGNDIVIIKDGNKTVTTGNGNDNIEIIGDGVHTIKTGNGENEVLLTGIGAKTVNGGAGIDNVTVTGNSAKTTLKLGNGDNIATVTGGTGESAITTGNGSDTITVSNTGKNVINAGAGADTIATTAGTNTITGGAGADTFKFTSGGGVNTITDATNEDKIQITNVNSGDLQFVKNGKNLDIFYNEDITSNNKIVVQNYFSKKAEQRVNELIAKDKTINIAEQTITVTGKGTITGSDENDTIIGSDTADTIKALAGDDIIVGGEGDDKLYGEAGSNTFIFRNGDGNDLVYCSGDEDTIRLRDANMENISMYQGKGDNKKDLIIKYSDEDSITIKDYYTINGYGAVTGINPANSAKYLETASGTVYNIEEFSDKFVFSGGNGIVDSKHEEITMLKGSIKDTIYFNSQDVSWGDRQLLPQFVKEGNNLRVWYNTDYTIDTSEYESRTKYEYEGTEIYNWDGNYVYCSSVIIKDYFTSENQNIEKYKVFYKGNRWGSTILNDYVESVSLEDNPDNLIDNVYYGSKYSENIFLKNDSEDYIIYANAGNDTIFASYGAAKGANIVYGGDGNDYIIGSNTWRLVDLGSGKDELRIYHDGGKDATDYLKIMGGTGENRITISTGSYTTKAIIYTNSDTEGKNTTDDKGTYISIGNSDSTNDEFIIYAQSSTTIINNYKTNTNDTYYVYSDQFTWLEDYGGNDVLNYIDSPDTTDGAHTGLHIIFNMEKGAESIAEGSFYIFNDENYEDWKTYPVFFGGQGIKIQNPNITTIETINASDGYQLTTTQLNELQSAVSGWLTTNNKDSVADVLSAGGDDAEALLAVFANNTNWQQIQQNA